jgi:hypothetical protein
MQEQSKQIPDQLRLSDIMELCEITESRIGNFIRRGTLPTTKVKRFHQVSRQDLIKFISYNPSFFSHLPESKLAQIMGCPKLAHQVKCQKPSVTGLNKRVRRIADGQVTEYPSVRAAANANFVSNGGIAKSIAAKREFFGGRYEYF